MAFDPRELSLAVDTISGGSIRLHFLDTADDEDTVTGADYITSAAKRGIRLNDLFVVRTSQPGPSGGTFLATVSGISAAGHGTLLVDRNLLQEYATNSALQAARVSPLSGAIRTQGSSLVGDGNGRLYRRVLAEPWHDAKLQSADGSWWERVPAVERFGAIHGLTLSNNNLNPNTRIDIAPGYASSDDILADQITLSQTLTKRLDALWVAGSGNGGLDKGAMAANTAYAVYLIGGAAVTADAILTATFGAPTLPTGYTEIRYLGSIITTAGNVIRAFEQQGDYFRFRGETLDIDTTSQTDTPVNYALPIPSGISVEVDLTARIYNASAGPALRVYHPEDTDYAPTLTGVGLGDLGTGDTSISVLGRVRSSSDTTRQVRVSMRAGGGNVLQAQVRGWRDPGIRIPPRRDVHWAGTSVLASGGRIDSVVDCGGGVMLMACRTNAPNTGKVFRTTDYGRTFSLETTLAKGISALATDGAGRVYALAEDSTLYVSTNKGLSGTWSTLGTVSGNATEFSGGLSYGLLVTAAGTVLITDTSAAGHIFRSVNGGVSFTDIGAVGGSHGLYRLQAVGDGILANGWEGKIYKSTDDGLNWSAGVSVVSAKLYAIGYLGSGIALTADENGVVYRSADNGATWATVATLDGGADDIADLGSGRAIYSTYTSKKQVYFTDDYGKTWRNLGVVPTGISGDWLDHVAPVQRGAKTVVVGGTNQGALVQIERAE